jgi:hypothetical protein
VQRFKNLYVKQEHYVSIPIPMVVIKLNFYYKALGKAKKFKENLVSMVTEKIIG